MPKKEGVIYCILIILFSGSKNIFKSYNKNKCISISCCFKNNHLVCDLNKHQIVSAKPGLLCVVGYTQHTPRVCHVRVIGTCATVHRGPEMTLS